MFKTGYETFVSRPDELVVGKEIQLEIRDCEKYKVKVVKAQVFPPEKKSTGEALWLRSTIGYQINEKPWKIKIIEVLEER